MPVLACAAQLLFTHPNTPLDFEEGGDDDDAAAGGGADGAYVRVKVPASSVEVLSGNQGFAVKNLELPAKGERRMASASPGAPWTGGGGR